MIKLIDYCLNERLYLRWLILLFSYKKVSSSFACFLWLISKVIYCFSTPLQFCRKILYSFNLLFYFLTCFNYSLKAFNYTAKNWLSCSKILFWCSSYLFFYKSGVVSWDYEYEDWWLWRISWSCYCNCWLALRVRRMMSSGWRLFCCMSI